MGPLRRVGAPRGLGDGEHALAVAQGGSYQVRIGGRVYPWDRVRLALRRALELDRPPGDRSQEARDLAALLWSPRPNRVQFILARPKLMEIWREIHE